MPKTNALQLSHEARNAMLAKLAQARGICNLASAFEDYAEQVPTESLADALEAAQDLLAQVHEELSILPKAIGP
jgi:hypothetical protein